MAPTAATQDVYVGVQAYQRGDYETALKNFRSLAEIDLDYTQLRIGENDPDINPLAQYYLGMMYCLGRGGPQDHAKATEWFHKAAKGGNANAQNATCP